MPGRKVTCLTGRPPDPITRRLSTGSQPACTNPELPVVKLHGDQTTDEGEPMQCSDGVRAPQIVVMAIVAAGAAGCGSSASQPATHATSTQARVIRAAPTAPPQTFTSRRYRFRVTLTKDWSEHDARVVWNGKQLQGLNSAAFANFADPSANRQLAAAAARVPNGTGLAEWRADMVRAAPSVCSESPSAEQTSLGGQPALAWTSSCNDGYQVHKIAAVRGTRGYIILLAASAASDETANLRVFESMRRSFRFTRT